LEEQALEEEQQRIAALAEKKRQIDERN
jgi:hypothetical protein